MVLQVPNTPDPNDIGRALDTIFQQWPELPRGMRGACVRRAHARRQFGNHQVPYISPERVQESTLGARADRQGRHQHGLGLPARRGDGVFPRGERRTHITQLLGRMVRTPLARRIPGNDRLNSVDCLLPKFDTKTVEEVVDALMKVATDTPPTGRVLINPEEMKPNPAVPEAVWEKFESLPSQTRPQRGAKPAKRLTALAHELASDDILPDAGGKAHAEMHKVLDDSLRTRQGFEAKRKAVMTVDGHTVVADLRKGETSDAKFQADADDAVIDDAYRRAARIISPDIARTYTMERA